MNIKEKIYDLVRESGIRGITIRRIQDRLDPMKIKLSEMRRILSEMSSQEEIIFRNGKYFHKQKNEKLNQQNEQAPENSGDFDFEDLRKICRFYSGVIERVKGAVLEFSPDDRELESELTTRVDWEGFSRGGIEIRRDHLPDRGSKLTSGKATFCGPFEKVRYHRRLNRKEAWLPIFVIHAKVQRTASSLVFEQLDGIDVNPKWLDYHCKTEEERNDLLIRMGFAYESQGKVNLISCSNLTHAWNYLSQNVSEIQWQERGVPSESRAFVGIRNKESLGVYPAILCLPWSKPRYGWGEIMEELSQISNQEDSVLEKTALRHYLSHAQETKPEYDPPETSFIYRDLLNHRQSEALKKSQMDNLVVIQGPPGTGKSTVVRNVILNQAFRKKSVLFCSQNHKAVDAVVPSVNSYSEIGKIVFDLRQDQDGENWVNQLSTNMQSEFVAANQSLTLLTAEANANFREIDIQKDKLYDIQKLRDLYTQSVIDLSEARSEIGGVISDLEEMELPVSKEGFIEVFNDAEFCWYSVSSWIQKWRQEQIHRGVSKRQNKNREITKEMLFDFTKVLVAREEAGNLEMKIRESESIQDLSSSLTVMEENSRPVMEEISGLIPCQYGNGFSGLVSELQNIINAYRRRKSNRNRFVDTCCRYLPKLIACLPAWASTNLSVPTRVPMVPGLFDLCVVDEAAQCDPTTVIPMLYRSRRALIVGDPKQLPPTSTIGIEKEDQLRQKYEVEDDKYNRFMYSKTSAYEVAQGALRINEKNEIFLREHYRCHPEIASFFNDEFYANKLIIRTRSNRSRFDGPRIKWIHVEGGIERVPPSLWWPPQCDAIIAELQHLKDINYEGSVGVVTPFNAHANRIRDRAYSEIGTQKLQSWDFISGTVDKFQGAEKDVILFGMIGGGTGPTPTPKFYSSELRRFNVALSRARENLNIYGDKDWAEECGVKVIENLKRYVDSLSDQQVSINTETRTELIGPVWEPLFGEKLKSSGIEYVPQYYSCGYYLDFAIFQNGQKINIEVDGETYHRDTDGALRKEDVYRDQILKADGWRVQRFWIYELREDIEKCLKTIRTMLE